MKHIKRIYEYFDENNLDTENNNFNEFEEEKPKCHTCGMDSHSDDGYVESDEDYYRNYDDDEDEDYEHTSTPWGPIHSERVKSFYSFNEKKV